MRRREELPVARDSYVNEDEELTAIHRLRGDSLATSFESRRASRKLRNPLKKATRNA